MIARPCSQYERPVNWRRPDAGRTCHHQARNARDGRARSVTERCGQWVSLIGICERCGFFDTGEQLIPILRRQRDHAVERDQHDRARLVGNLLDGIDNQPPDMLQ